ncbi:Uncharacterised protein [uncultured archaeon]|nr:Uncharacterised protein [uncultured archaeon]
MSSSEEYFGSKAGIVWKVLNENGLLSIPQLMSKTKMSQNQIYGALGWLARESKINVEGTGLKMKFGLIK